MRYILKVVNFKMAQFASRAKSGGGVGNVLQIFLNFHQIFHRFTLNFPNTSFQVLKAWTIVYENMKTPNPSRRSLVPHLKKQYFQIISKCYFALNHCAEKPREMWIVRSEEAWRGVSDIVWVKWICNQLSQNEHKAATAAIKIIILHNADFNITYDKWVQLIVLGSKNHFLCWFSFVS